ncbi:hypothetical protein C8Q76DRAFT_793718 [Earliella scabrosa]|nr:hypothetical protein C8Q76DRAFT_793718 [Earliella scabrosa]
MGKWTLEYHDEVLRNKVKSLVQGAIKRMKVEDEKPTITYEAFVEDLDEGDSFTASLVDVLVKELAERRTRPNPGDRRLISERTAKSLRMQAAPLHVYRGSHGSHGPRERNRRVPIPARRRSSSFYSNFNDMLSDSDGEAEYGTVLGSSSQLEGARLNTDLYDAYFPSTLDLPGTLSRTDRPSSPPQPPETASSGTWFSISPPPRAPSTMYNTSGPAWTGLGGPGSSLSRTSTIRRSSRPRTLDMSDFASFTSRRRSAIRNSSARDEGSREGSSTDTAGRSAEPSVSPADASSSGPYDLSAWISRAGASSGNAPSGGSTYEDSATSTSSHPSSSQMWFSMTSGASSPFAHPSLAALPRRSSTTDLNDDRRQAIAPRLRRGGLRPPESLLLHGPGSSAPVTAERASAHTSHSMDTLRTDAHSPEQPGSGEETVAPPPESSTARATSPIA